MPATDSPAMTAGVLSVPSFWAATYSAEPTFVVVKIVSMMGAALFDVQVTTPREPPGGTG
jgi:hypothetical protein